MKTADKDLEKARRVLQKARRAVNDARYRVDEMEGVKKVAEDDVDKALAQERDVLQAAMAALDAEVAARAAERENLDVLVAAADAAAAEAPAGGRKTA